MRHVRVHPFLSVCVGVSLHLKRLHSLDHVGQAEHLEGHISEVFLLFQPLEGGRRLLLQLQSWRLALPLEDWIGHHELVQIHKVVFALGLDPLVLVLA